MKQPSHGGSTISSDKNRIVKAMKSRYTRKMLKFGIQVPENVVEVYEIDHETGIDYWHQAILKEMKNNS
jgi:hypothetical protein